MNNSSNICTTLSNVNSSIYLLNLGLTLNRLVKCIKSFAKDVCYIYFPQRISTTISTKGQIYEEINRSILIYQGDYAYRELRTLMLRFIHNVTDIPKKSLSQGLIEFKSISTLYRYVLIPLAPHLYTIITPTSIIKDINNIDNIMNIIVKNIARYTDYKDIKFIRTIIQLNGDRLSFKYRCMFNHMNLELSIINIIYLFTYISTIIVHKPLI